MYRALIQARFVNPEEYLYQEIFSLDELVAAFSLDKVNSSGAKYDPEKAKWFQQQWFVQQDDAVVGAAFAKALQLQ